MRRFILIALVPVFLFATASSAGAHVAAVDDPQEAPPNLSGPKDPDVKRMVVGYSPKGALTFQVELWEPLAEDNGFLGLYLYTSLGRNEPFAISPSIPATTICSSKASAQLSIGSEYGSLTIPGYQGSLEPMMYRATPDKRTFIYYYRHDALANQNPDCGYWGLSASVYSMSGSSYSSSCNCFPSSRTLDGSPFSSTDSPLPFDASTPACDDGADNDGDGLSDLADPGCLSQVSGPSEDNLLPACDDGFDNDNDGKTDTKDPGCKGKATGASEVDPRKVATRYSLKVGRSKCVIDTEVTALPDLKPLALFPWNKVVVEVGGTTKANRYKVTRKLPLGQVRGYSFATKKSGKFRVRSWYPGDKWRAKSPVRTKFVTLPASCKR